ncbi:hypothetical protein [Micromonospora inaquosa]|nr:hypothetical protein [Micromonospora inaquosa]
MARPLTDTLRALRLVATQTRMPAPARATAQVIRTGPRITTETPVRRAA